MKDINVHLLFNRKPLFLFFLLVLTQVHPCLGSDKENGKQKAEQGLLFVEQENYPAALAAFREAYDLYPKVELLFNIAMCQKALYRYVASIRTFERFLNRGGNAVDAALRDDAQTAIALMKTQVGRLQIEGAPAGARVLIDDIDVEKTPLIKPLLVDPGDHILRITKQGYKPLRKKVTVESGTPLHLQVTLEVEERKVDAPKGESSAIQHPVTVLQPHGSDSGEYQISQDTKKADGSLRVVGWGTVAVGGGLLVGGAVTGGLALKHNNTLVDDCKNNNCIESEIRDDLDQRDRLAVTTNILLATGAVVAAAGVTLLLLSLRDEKRVENEITVSPVLGRMFAGATLEGRF